MRRISAEHGHGFGKEGQFFECMAHTFIFGVAGVAFDVGVELRGLKRATNHIAF